MGAQAVSASSPDADETSGKCDKSHLCLPCCVEGRGKRATAGERPTKRSSSKKKKSKDSSSRGSDLSIISHRKSKEGRKSLSRDLSVKKDDIDGEKQPSEKRPSRSRKSSTDAGVESELPSGTPSEKIDKVEDNNDPESKKSLERRSSRRRSSLTTNDYNVDTLVSRTPPSIIIETASDELQSNVDAKVNSPKKSALKSVSKIFNAPDEASPGGAFKEPSEKMLLDDQLKEDPDGCDTQTRFRIRRNSRIRKSYSEEEIDEACQAERKSRVRWSKEVSKILIHEFQKEAALASSTTETEESEEGLAVMNIPSWPQNAEQPRRSRTRQSISRGSSKDDVAVVVVEASPKEEGSSPATVAAPQPDASQAKDDITTAPSAVVAVPESKAEEAEKGELSTSASSSEEINANAPFAVLGAADKQEGQEEVSGAASSSEETFRGGAEKGGT